MFNLHLPSGKEIAGLLKAGWADLYSLDFFKVKYADPTWSLYVGGILLAIVMLKWWGGRRNRWRGQSGLFIAQGYGQNFLVKALIVLSRLSLAVPLLLILGALADPFLEQIREEIKIVEARTRVDLRDVSSSMGYEFDSTKKSKAEIAHNAHLRFLEMRRGKGDRASFWVFSTNPFLMEDFVTDDELYYMQVEDAPWELAGANPDFIDWQNILYPRSRYRPTPGEGGTLMSRPLEAIIRQFDEDEARSKKSPYYKGVSKKAIVMITDAEVSDFSDTEQAFTKFPPRKIIPYIILINASSEATDVKKMLLLVGSYGGKVFAVKDERGFTEAFREIDKLEKVKFEVEKKVYRIRVFEPFIFGAILSLLVIIPVGLIIDLWLVPHP